VLWCLSWEVEKFVFPNSLTIKQKLELDLVPQSKWLVENITWHLKLTTWESIVISFRTIWNQMMWFISTMEKPLVLYKKYLKVELRWKWKSVDISKQDVLLELHQVNILNLNLSLQMILEISKPSLNVLWLTSSQFHSFHKKLTCKIWEKLLVHLDKALVF